MINKKENPVSWALLLMELDEAREHLDTLVDEMNKNGFVEDEEFSLNMEHIYAHLNRVWNSRNYKDKEEYTDEQREEFTKNFPKDLFLAG